MTFPGFFFLVNQTRTHHLLVLLNKTSNTDHKLKKRFTCGRNPEQHIFLAIRQLKEKKIVLKCRIAKRVAVVLPLFEKCVVLDKHRHPLTRKILEAKAIADLGDLRVLKLSVAFGAKLRFF